jgi:hypothetical protein
MRIVEDELLADPERGVLLRDAGGVRKIRAAQETRGKRGGARVVYLHVAERETVYFIFAFGKNMQENLTAAQRKVVRQLVAMLRGEEWPKRKRGRT